MCPPSSAKESQAVPNVFTKETYFLSLSKLMLPEEVKFNVLQEQHRTYETK